jgi:hypothetical protein
MREKFLNLELEIVQSDPFTIGICWNNTSKETGKIGKTHHIGGTSWNNPLYMLEKYSVR